MTNPGMTPDEETRGQVQALLESLQGLTGAHTLVLVIDGAVARVWPGMALPQVIGELRAAETLARGAWLKHRIAWEWGEAKKPEVTE